MMDSEPEEANATDEDDPERRVYAHDVMLEVLAHTPTGSDSPVLADVVLLVRGFFVTGTLVSQGRWFAELTALTEGPDSPAHAFLDAVGESLSGPTGGCVHLANARVSAAGAHVVGPVPLRLRLASIDAWLPGTVATD